MFHIGIDEAGYGPNLGPLVQAAVALRAPASPFDGWAALSDCVRRAVDRADDRVLVDDSKLVHVGTLGFERLEQSISSCLLADQTVGELLTSIGCGDTLGDLAGEPWYKPEVRLPILAERSAECPVRRKQLRDVAMKAGIEIHSLRVVVTPAPRFNVLSEKWDSKGAVLAQGLITLLQEMDRVLPAGEALEFAIDKHGGRTFYAPMIQTAFPNAWATPLVETADDSSYRIDGHSRPIELHFRPRSDSTSLPAALASMLAKYLREVFMRQFNAFWIERVPGIEPTAGYPNDSKRFFGLIQRAMRELGIKENHVWRAR